MICLNQCMKIHINTKHVDDLNRYVRCDRYSTNNGNISYSVHSANSCLHIFSSYGSGKPNAGVLYFAGGWCEYGIIYLTTKPDSFNITANKTANETFTINITCSRYAGLLLIY